MNTLDPTLIKKVFIDPGYSNSLYLSDGDLQKARELINEHWIGRIGEIYPQRVAEFKNCGIFQYHLLSDSVDHKALWPVQARYLSKEASSELLNLGFFGDLHRLLGDYKVEHYIDHDYPEFTWRLVRPNRSSDVGPMHADGWFWEVSKTPMPSNRVRIKCWIAIYTEPGLSGLRVVPSSHYAPLTYHVVTRDGMSKPQIDAKEEDLAITMLNNNPGNVVIFHDKLLHGGAVTRGSTTRVSIEFTISIDRDLVTQICPSCQNFQCE